MKAPSPRSSATRCMCCSARPATSPITPTARSPARSSSTPLRRRSVTSWRATRGRARRHPHRRSCRPGDRRQFRRRPLLRLHGLWRHDQHRGAARGRQQAAGNAHLRQRKRSPGGSTDFRGRPVGDLVLRGRREPLRAFEPLLPEQYDDPSDGKLPRRPSPSWRPAMPARLPRSPRRSASARTTSSRASISSGC